MMDKKIVLLIFAVLMAIIMAMVLTYSLPRVGGDIKANLQAEMVENASLRMKVVELEEMQKVYAEVFECVEIRRGLGL